MTDIDVDDGTAEIPDIEPLEDDPEPLPPPIDPLPVPGAEGLPDDVKNGDADFQSEEP